ncbi:hypothetical protein DPM19_00590 [Actinomadura craniellae]|uniref:DUF1697 domain-containing protein n=2 Tax=Actinomadura craniellae TaxID=2231787 RepID=A0A365HDT3_9ACTN|nr:DUF1697 domain-containing protein [Actinomadura craniellae]RAY17265.1 hypothetical protein DPM19_00590 [Actinomadura craniellae]
MTRYVALLRGINVGGPNKIAMADLRELLVGLGYADVTTYLRTGNAVFTAPDRAGGELAAEIEGRITGELGLTVVVMMRTAAELRGVVDRNPVPVRDPAKFAVAFLSGAPDPGLPEVIDPRAYAPEEMHLGERELYLYFPHGLGRAKLNPLLAKHLKVDATVRNWNTVTRVLDMAEGG